MELAITDDGSLTSSLPAEIQGQHTTSLNQIRNNPTYEFLFGFEISSIFFHTVLGILLVTLKKPIKSKALQFLNSVHVIHIAHKIQGIATDK